MRFKLLAAAALLTLAACGKSPSPPATEGVTDAMIANPPEGEWLTVAGDHLETRFSTLTKISDQNVGELGLAWSADKAAIAASVAARVARRRPARGD